MRWCSSPNTTPPRKMWSSSATCAESSPSSAVTYVGPPAAMRAPLRNCRFSCCANWHRAHAHVVPSSFEPDLIVSRFSRTLTALLRTKRCMHP